MAGSFIPPPADLGAELAELRRRVTNLETSPAAGNQSISNGFLAILDLVNTEQLRVGKYVWPTYPWEGQNVFGLISFDGSGHPIVVCGMQPDGLYGLSIYSAAGDRQVLLGQQGGGLIGLGVLTSDGDFQQVAGAITRDAATVGSFSSTTPTLITGSPIETTIGPSGEALVMVSCQMSTNAAGIGANCALYIDGADATFGVSVSDASGGILVTESHGGLVGGLSPGLHTFELRIFNSGSGTNGYASPTLTVLPL